MSDTDTGITARLSPYVKKDESSSHHVAVVNPFLSSTSLNFCRLGDGTVAVSFHDGKHSNGFVMDWATARQLAAELAKLTSEVE